jgi:predicted phosphoadenosine phosphosulfate sulfurtransferase
VTFLKGRKTDVSTLDAARERFRIAYERYDRIVVSFSGGKDSSCCLHLAIEAARAAGRLPVEAVFVDEEAIYPQTVEYVDRWSRNPDVKLHWICYPIQHRNACSPREPYWYPWDPADQHRWVRPLPPQAITTLPYHHGASWHLTMPDIAHWMIPDVKPGQRILQILGIRANESLRRRGSVSRRETDNWIMEAPTAKQYFRAYPIYDWVAEDVWTYAHMKGMEFNPIYTEFDMCGVPPEKQRVCPPFGEEPLAGLGLYKLLAPSTWARMVGRCAGVATAARYADTELYAYGNNFKPPPGMTWRTWMQSQLLRWNDDDRGAIANSIKLIMEDHRSKTTDPIPDTDPHAMSGASWRVLAMIAIRGDLKGRKAGMLARAAKAKREKLGIDNISFDDIESDVGEETRY